MRWLAEQDALYFHGFRNVGMRVGHWKESGHRAAAEIMVREQCARPP